MAANRRRRRGPPSPSRGAVTWLAIAAAVVAFGWGLDQAGLPSSYLFGGLLIGIAVALARSGDSTLPAGAFSAAQAVAGVAFGGFIRSDALTAVAHDWLPVALVSGATLVASLAVGAVMTRITALDARTAALGTIAGGASGIVVMARELGGDDRLVAFMQYMRVLIVVVVTPVLAALLFDSHSAAHAPGVSGEPLLGDPGGWLLTLCLAPLGALAGTLARLPAGRLLGPMILSAVITITAPFGDLTVPPLLREAAFAAIGVQIGLGFTVDTLRTVGRLLPGVLAGVAMLIAACFGLAAVLAATASVPLIDAYLATTPGGLFVVLPLALGSGANATFVVAVQGIRVLVMVLLAPLAVRALIAWSR